MNLKEISSSLKKNSQLLNILRCYCNITRNELCELMDQSWPTIIKSIEEMKRFHILEENKEFSINPYLGYYVGISVGGSQIKLSIINMNFQILSRSEFENLVEPYNLFKKGEWLKHSENDLYGYRYTQTPDDISVLQSRIDYLLSEIIELDKALLEKDEHVFGIGFAFTGAIDNKAKKIIKAYSLKCLNTLPLSYDSLIFDKRLSYFNSNYINLSFDNIAKSALISEKFALYDSKNSNSRYNYKRNIGCIYLGSGIGGALIFNNILYRGTSNFNELGHFDVIDDSPSYKNEDNKQTDNIDDDCCSCGGRNCLEFKIRKNVFGLNFKEFSSFTSSELRTRFNKLDDEEKKRKLKLLAFYINQSIKTLTNILNLDLIILTGKITTFMDELSNYLYEEKSKNTIGYTNVDCSMVVSNYGALAPSIGAAITSSFDEDYEIVWK